MSFNFAPWAIDGARSTSALARVASYAAGGGRSGIVSPADLRVVPLSVPGNGLRITKGSASILNHYQSDPDQAYVVSNPSTHTVLSDAMPPAIPATGYYIVCAVVGDPEFDQTGHPFMPSTPLDPEVAADFEYVRVVVMPSYSFTTRFDQLGHDYPGIALARLEIPPNTTTITAAMITDLRTLAQPRSERHVLAGQPANGPLLDSTDFRDVGTFHPSVLTPPWATRCTVVATMTGLTHIDPEATGYMRLRVAGINGANTQYELAPSGGAGEQITLQATFSEDISEFADVAINIVLQANRIAGAGRLQVYGGMTNVVYDVQFDETPIS